ncbi:hypothetical protein [Sporichthya sp.]|uniref:hypothetical protein n=1 Tax=Sporichthya sp. TaxID=65475 RepID=UPI0018324648|nr:hypothetical protein [Sporichthya sp.]MBA3743294.1 hypothetical protein [Sporichthya sp.]
MRVPPKRRLSVPMTPDDDRALEALRADPDALGLTGRPSDAQLLHAVFRLGLAQLEERRAEEAYAALALTYDDITARRVARRRSPLSAGDE